MMQAQQHHVQAPFAAARPQGRAPAFSSLPSHSPALARLRPASITPCQQLLLALPSLQPRRASLITSAVACAPQPVAAPGTGHKYDREVAAAVDAVRLASKLCQAVQLQLKAGEKQEKDDASPVTVADYGAQALVTWSLRHSFPDQPLSLVGEEDSADLRVPEGAAMLGRITSLVNDALRTLPSAPQVTAEEVADLIDLGASPGGPVGRHWVLDPIDGTRGFVGMRQYAICLGMVQDGKVEVGVLGCPNMPQAPIRDDDCTDVAQRSFDDDVGMVFAAQRGAGTFAGPLWDDGVPTQRVFVDDAIPAAEARYMESFETKHSNHALAEGIAEEIGLELPSLRLDSQAKYGALARGDASIFMRFPPVTYQEKPWDHCAGSIIVEEAGGVITDAAGQPLDFSKGRILPLNAGNNPGIIAASPSMHAAILKAFQKRDV